MVGIHLRWQRIWRQSRQNRGTFRTTMVGNDSWNSNRTSWSKTRPQEALIARFSLKLDRKPIENAIDFNTHSFVCLLASSVHYRYLGCASSRGQNFDPPMIRI